MELIAFGILKVLEGLANLMTSAGLMPDNFMGQISEELLGVDVSQPLAFERTTSLNGEEATGGEMSALIEKGTYDESDFSVDPVPNDFELSPELMSTLLASEGLINFGENDQSIDDLKAGLDTAFEPSEGTEGEMDIPQDPYEQVDWFIDYQNKTAPVDTSADTADGKEPADSGTFPEEMKLIGPLTVGSRIYYVKEQMMAGIRKKWEENKWTYIGIGAAVVIGVTALAIFTAGAIFALIPPALQILAAIMFAAAMAKATGFFKKFMEDGWAGKTLSAGKALARAIGILLIELLFILLFDSSALFKTLKATVKGGVKGAVKLGVHGVKRTKDAIRIGLRNTQRGVVKQAGRVKFFVKGVGSKTAKGAKNFKEFGRRLAKKLTFKGFKIERQGKWFNVYGEINPWVLLASGKIVEVKNKGGVKVGETGKFITKSGDDVGGILVGTERGLGGNKSQFVKNLENGVEDANAFLKLTDDAARKKIITGVNGFDYAAAVKEYGKKVADIIKYRSRISKNAGKHLAGEFDQAHHLIPVELIRKSKIIRKAIEGGFDFNGKINSKWLKQFSSKVDDLKDGVHASHPKYTDNVLKKINDDIIDFAKDKGKFKIDDLTDIEIKEFMEYVVKDIDDIISANPTKKINELVF